MTSTNAQPSDGQTPDHLLPAGADQWTGYLLAYVSGLAERVYAEEVARIGLKPLHLAVLGILARDGPLVQARLSEKLCIFKPVMVGLLNELQAMQLVARRRPVADQRAYEVHLTDAGRERLRLVQPINQAVTQQFFRALTDDEQALLHDLVLRLARSNGPEVPADEERRGEDRPDHEPASHGRNTASTRGRSAEEGSKKK